MFSTASEDDDERVDTQINAYKRSVVEASYGDEEASVQFDEEDINELVRIEAEATRRTGEAKKKNKKRRWERSKYSNMIIDEADLLQSEAPQPSTMARYSNSQLAAAGVVQESGPTSAPASVEGDVEWEHVPPQDIVFPDEEGDHSYCFMCDHSQNGREMIANPRYQRLKLLYDNNCGLVHPVRLAQMIQEEYETEIRKRTQDDKHWSLESIHKHFTEHSPSNIAMLEDSLRVFNSAMTVLKQEGIFLLERFTKKQKIDQNGAKMYLALFSQRKALMQDILGKRQTNIA